jgi:preprotein translocase subunit YajC
MNPAGQPSALEMFLPWIVLLPIFYFLIIRPQGKRLKEHESFLSNLKRGDAVITNSGILGTIDGMTEDYVTLEVAPNVKIKMLKKQIASSQAKADSKKQS